MPAGCICGSRVRYAGYERCLTCAAPGYYSQCRSDTTSTVVKAPLVCAWFVKWRYTKYPTLPLPLCVCSAGRNRSERSSGNIPDCGVWGPRIYRCRITRSHAELSAILNVFNDVLTDYGMILNAESPSGIWMTLGCSLDASDREAFQLPYGRVGYTESFK